MQAKPSNATAYDRRNFGRVTAVFLNRKHRKAVAFSVVELERFGRGGSVIVFVLSRVSESYNFQ